MIELPVGTLEILVNGRAVEAPVTVLPTVHKLFFVEGRLQFELDLPGGPGAVVECVFASDQKYESCPNNAENLAAISFDNERFRVSVGFTGDAGQLNPTCAHDRLVLRVSGPTSLTGRAAWLVRPKNPRRDTSVDLAVDSF